MHHLGSQAVGGEQSRAVPAEVLQRDARGEHRHVRHNLKIHQAQRHLPEVLAERRRHTARPQYTLEQDRPQQLHHDHPRHDAKVNERSAPPVAATEGHAPHNPDDQRAPRRPAEPRQHLPDQRSLQGERQRIVRTAAEHGERQSGDDAGNRPYRAQNAGVAEPPDPRAGHWHVGRVERVRGQQGVINERAHCRLTLISAATRRERGSARPPPPTARHWRRTARNAPRIPRPRPSHSPPDELHSRRPTCSALTALLSPSPSSPR